MVVSVHQFFILIFDSLGGVYESICRRLFSTEFVRKKIGQNKNRSALPGSLANMRQDYNSSKLHIPKKRKKNVYKCFKQLWDIKMSSTA